MSARARPSARARAFTLLEVLIVLGVILVLASLVLGIGTAVIRGAERAQLEAAMETVDKAAGEWESTTGRPLSFVGRLAGTGGAAVPDAQFSTEPAVLRFDVREADSGAPSVISGTAMPGGLAVAAQAIARAQGSGIYCMNLLARTDFTKDQIATIPTGVFRPEANSSTWPTAINGYSPSFRQGSPRGELVDPWGRRVAFVFPGRPFRWGGTDPGLPDEDGTVRTSVEQVLGSCVGRRICLVSAGPDGVFGPEASTAANRAAAMADNVYLYPLLPPNGN